MIMIMIMIIIVIVIIVNENRKCLLTAENKVTSKIIGKYIHLMVQKRKKR